MRNRKTTKKNMNNNHEAYVLYDTEYKQYLKYDGSNHVFYWVEQLSCAEFYAGKISANQDLKDANQQGIFGKIEILRITVDLKENEVN